MYRPISETSADPLPATHNTTTISLYCNFNGWSIFDIPAKDRRLAVFLQDGHALDFIFLRWTVLRLLFSGRETTIYIAPCPRQSSPPHEPQRIIIILAHRFISHYSVSLIGEYSRGIRIYVVGMKLVQ
ncbi:hypothetical protein H112_03394 [Trichophyton rubrum D6]|uniref:Uncharacterized protein n=3 Tax=Trichophyton TaxID=5550 RepID=F2SQ56_TRIRC|nr:uncharacterized protein TERG_04724 [Trichophyton rubrum CBS 118892]EZF24020.1 hypothetical protein H100_03398 [Trichophyton rubrum MR850]EZF43059.1 hypothetical protein H102_03393 [Trichophyton rubrum CBS 100081]EZF53697.1 hypothetical protein H103_03404 [Trichophyton rubrum CBS 288.86]EZF64322.1 hypothetical protein H104_03387 [Trichophyton rubrum CBS 289.86]EZF74940.1 hypothetical protein H105_03411 [Trichophyton soudanense CBS 452.61]EZF85616.1 hypothetical protein H110_03399 [Trichophy